MGGKKVCIVTLGSLDEEFADQEYNIIILDLDSGVDSRSRIRLNRKCIIYAAFCVFGSTLYAFTGYHSMCNPDEWKSINKYELPTAEIFDIKLDMSMFVEAGLLKHPKLYPIATVLSDGRILVFSTDIVVWGYQLPGYDFEIFDPVEGVSHELPKLRPEILGGSDSFIILSHAIMEKCFLVIQTEVGCFSLNLKPPYKSKRWGIRGLSNIQLLPSHMGRSFVLLGKEICLIPFLAFDMCGVKKDENPFYRWRYEFPHLSSIPDVGYSSVFGEITVMEDVGIQDQIELCLLSYGVKSGTGQAHVLLNVYSLDVKECRKELSTIRQNLNDNGNMELLPLPGATKIKSYEFMVEAQPPFFVEYFSFIRTT